MKKENKVYKTIISKLVTMIEKTGELPWNKPWKGIDQVDRNMVSERCYRGINRLITAFQQYPSPFWLTFKQVKELGGTIKSGESGTPIVYWLKVYLDQDGNKVDEKIVETMTEDERAELKLIFSPRYYTIFNAKQCELNGKEKEVPVVELAEHERITRCENVIKSYRGKPEIQEIKSSRAYYSPSNDLIVLPLMGQFGKVEDYYSTLFHESIHSTGHKSRLGRLDKQTMNFDAKQDYSFEELVAEIGSAFIGADCGIEKKVIDNSAAYLQGWLKVLKSDSAMLFKAAAVSEKAVAYIYGK